MGSGPLFFLAGVGIHVTLVFALQAWTIRAQDDLFRRVAQTAGLGVAFESADLRRDLMERPLSALLATPRRSLRMLRIATRPLKDPEAERLRRVYLGRRNLTLLALFGGVASPIYFSSLGQW